MRDDLHSRVDVRRNGRKMVPAVLLFVLTGIASAQQIAQPDAATGHLEEYLQEMQADMEAIEKEPDAETRRTLMRRHMQSMAKAMAIMQNELLPSLQARAAANASSPGRMEGSADASDFASSGSYASSGANVPDLATAIEMADEVVLLRQIEAVLDQMSRHREALEDSQDQ